MHIHKWAFKKAKIFMIQKGQYQHIIQNKDDLGQQIITIFTAEYPVWINQ